MLSTLAGQIHDNRFLRLVRNMLQAGYLEGSYSAGRGVVGGGPELKG